MHIHTLTLAYESNRHNITKTVLNIQNKMSCHKKKYRKQKSVHKMNSNQYNVEKYPKIKRFIHTLIRVLIQNLWNAYYTKKPKWENVQTKKHKTLKNQLNNSSVPENIEALSLVPIIHFLLINIRIQHSCITLCVCRPQSTYNF